MVDADSILRLKRDDIAAMERALETARAELRGMEAFAAAIAPAKWPTPPIQVRTPTPVRSDNNHPARRRAAAAAVAGRQPGSISKRWRQIMADLLAWHPTWFAVESIVAAVATRENRGIRTADARRQFETFIEHGYAEKDDDGRFRVTEAAVQKFDLASLMQDQDIGDEAPNENAPPSGEPEDGAETALDAQGGGPQE